MQRPRNQTESDLIYLIFISTWNTAWKRWLAFGHFYNSLQIYFIMQLSKIWMNKMYQSQICISLLHYLHYEQDQLDKMLLWFTG